MPEVDGLGRHDDWSGVRAVVAGFGVSGFAAADNLIHIGAQVRALTERASDEELEKAELLEVLGGRVDIHEGATTKLPEDVDVVVTSPGFPPSAPLLVAARDRGIPVWGEVELAWRLRDPAHAAPWLAVTGTNGKTTTVQMLHAILTAAGLRSAAVGNVGRPVTEAVMDPTPYDVLAVELSSFQLHYTQLGERRGGGGAEHRRGPPRLVHRPDRHGRLRRRQGPHLRAGRAGLHLQRGRRRDRAAGARGRRASRAPARSASPSARRRSAWSASSRTCSSTGPSSRSGRRARPSCAPIADLPSPAPHVVANALAAAALARAHGVSQAAVRDGLRGFTIDGHRIQTVAVDGDVTWVDDSKATNPHAAQSSLQAFDHVVWVAGGLAKGARFDDLVTAVRDRLRGVVLLGRDRGVIADALARHAPDVPVIDTGADETESGSGPMERVVEAAARLARPGDAVLLAPGCASQDMFRNYGERGDAFAAAVRRRTDHT